MTMYQAFKMVDGRWEKIGNLATSKLELELALVQWLPKETTKVEPVDGCEPVEER